MAKLRIAGMTVLGRIDSAEDCEGTDPRNQTCLGLYFAEGTLKCDPVSCRYDTSDCRGKSCGNGKLEPQLGESCDGTDLGNVTTCADYNPSLSGGFVHCKTDCSYDISECHGCLPSRFFVNCF